VQSSLDRLLALPDTLARAAAVALDLLRNRLELVSLEAREEGLRFVDLAIRTAAGIVFAALALVLLTLGAVYALPGQWRFAGFLGFGCLYALAAYVAFRSARRRLRETRPFSRSVEALKKDRECL